MAQPKHRFAVLVITTESAVVVLPDVGADRVGQLLDHAHGNFDLWVTTFDVTSRVTGRFFPYWSISISPNYSERPNVR